MTDILTLINHISKEFKHIYNYPSQQQQVAWWLLQDVTGQRRAELLAQKEIELTPEQREKLNQNIASHAKDLKPLQYIIGWVPFGPLKLFVETPVLIPRPETEEWSIDLIKTLKPVADEPLHILDIGTGSGALALTLANALPNARVVATDISENALALAQKNAKTNNISSVRFFNSDVYESLAPEHQFDVIISNPPYISLKEWQELSPMVKKWEDQTALSASGEGFAIITRIINQAKEFLKPQSVVTKHNLPRLIIEVGPTQAQAVKKLMEQAGFTTVHIKKDLEGKDRIVMGIP